MVPAISPPSIFRSYILRWWTVWFCSIWSDGEQFDSPGHDQNSKVKGIHNFHWCRLYVIICLCLHTGGNWVSSTIQPFGIWNVIHSTSESHGYRNILYNLAWHAQYVINLSPHQPCLVANCHLSCTSQLPLRNPECNVWAQSACCTESKIFCDDRMHLHGFQNGLSQQKVDRNGEQLITGDRWLNPAVKFSHKLST